MRHGLERVDVGIDPYGLYPRWDRAKAPSLRELAFAKQMTEGVFAHKPYCHLAGDGALAVPHRLRRRANTVRPYHPATIST